MIGRPGKVCAGDEESKAQARERRPARPACPFRWANTFRLRKRRSCARKTFSVDGARQRRPVCRHPSNWHDCWPGPQVRAGHARLSAFPGQDNSVAGESSRRFKTIELWIGTTGTGGHGQVRLVSRERGRKPSWWPPATSLGGSRTQTVASRRLFRSDKERDRSGSKGQAWLEPARALMMCRKREGRCALGVRWTCSPSGSSVVAKVKGAKAAAVPV